MNFLILLVRDLGSNVYLLLLYSAVACILYYLLPQKLRNGWLLVCSVAFYALCSLRFLVLILAETVISWLIGKKIGRERTAEGDGRRHGWLAAGVVLCIGILALFKYWNFFLDIFRIPAAQILMPIGISYYSFRIVSYLADIDLGKREAEPSFPIYAVYVMFFPQLLSGPIARSEDMTARMHRGIRFSSSDLERGIRLIISGMFKKVVIADRISGYPSAIFADPSSYPALAAWLGAILYSIQLYCDFAGYSEIAVGITRCFGFDCPDNFIRPYLSTDMKEFWHRWHVSLSSWLRDYIYIPCGGSRVDRKWKAKRNVMITFAVCGLWHGSGMKYLAWGLYHGVWNILVPKKRKCEGTTLKTSPMTGADPVRGVLTERKKSASAQGRMGSHVLQSVIVFLIAMFGWILFKAESFAAAAEYVRCMFHGFSLNFASIEAAILPFTSDNSCVAYALTAFLMILLLFIIEVKDERREQRIRKTDAPQAADQNRPGRAGHVKGHVNAGGYSNLQCGILLALVILFSAAGTGSFLYVNY